MKTRVVLLIFITIILASCSSSYKDEFAQAINTRLDQKDACIAIQPDFRKALLANKKHVVFPLSLTLRNARDDQSFDTLVKAGLLTSRDAIVQSLNNGKVPGKTYSLTAAGQKVSRAGYWLCIGRYQVVKVLDYTSPGKRDGGTVRSVVDFSYAPELPAWAAKNFVKATYPALYEMATAWKQNKAKASLPVTRMGSGWKVNHVSKTALSRAMPEGSSSITVYTRSNE